MRILIVIMVGISVSQVVVAQADHYNTKRMADGKLWITENLRIKINESFCYDDKEINCEKYGRIYTWKAAIEGCRSLGIGWRLPGEDEWEQLAHAYGGIRGDSEDDGKSAFAHLFSGGDTGFNILLGGGREVDQTYKRLEAHGFYWTSTATSDSTAWIYNFGKNLRIINHHDDNEKVCAVSVRCVKD